MHIIESGDLAKPVATLSPLTKLSGNDAYYSTYYLHLQGPHGRKRMQAISEGWEQVTPYATKRGLSAAPDARAPSRVDACCLLLCLSSLL